MTRLTPIEREGLAAAAGAISTWPHEYRQGHQRAARILADHLRKNLPDVGDTTIARVLYHLAAFHGPMADRVGSTTMIESCVLAALELTEFERGEPGTGGVEGRR